MIPKLSWLLVSLAFFSRVTLSHYQYLGCQEPSEVFQYSFFSIYQAVGLCGSRCNGAGSPVAGLSNGTDCFCSTSLPPPDNVVEDDSWCDRACNGYPHDTCIRHAQSSILCVQAKLTRENRRRRRTLLGLVPWRPGGAGEFSQSRGFPTSR
ncbi:hypothetical protein M426DRAFT_316744 [Hypoxylon sp. CI-4A]|nr:hypothetical protein M426DRAFT_316744 [Hypoxylon sp. CI-4A]